MNKIYILLCVIGACIPSLSHTYKYAFINRSDKAAEAQFKLALDLTTNYKIETVSIPANSTSSITIPEWYRSGLCIDPYSIRIRFLPNGTFQKPQLTKKWFEELVQKHEFPKSAPYGSVSSFNTLRVPSFECGDQTYEFTYYATDSPIIKIWW